MRWRFGFLALLAAAIGVVVLTTGASQAARARSATGSKGPCYPISAPSPTFGSFSVASTVRGGPTTAEIDSGGDFPHSLIETTALVSFSFRGSGTASGNIQAALDYLTITWGQGAGGKVTHFTAKCVQELSVDSSGTDRSFEAELEGTADFLPGVGGPVDVIASISVSKDGSSFAHSISLEEGVTCAEGHDIGGSPNFGFPYEPESSSKSKDFAHGSFSAPYDTSFGAYNWTGACADGSI